MVEIGAAIAHELSLDPQKVVEIVLHAAAAAVEAAVLEVGQSGIKAQIGVLAEYLYFLKVLRIDDDPNSRRIPNRIAFLKFIPFLLFLGFVSDSQNSENHVSKYPEKNDAAGILALKRATQRPCCALAPTGGNCRN